MSFVNTPVGFNRLGNFPLDKDTQVADITARNALPSGSRYIGQDCYVLSENKPYKLIGGITNAHWVDMSDYYKKSEVNALISDLTNVNNNVWQQSFFDRSGFGLSASGTGSSANIPQINEAVAYTPAQGIVLLRSGTASNGSSSIRRDSTNGVAYQYYFDNAYFKFDTWVRFSEIPTASKVFTFLKSFHNTTGPGTDRRIAITMEWNATISPNRAVFAIRTNTNNLTTYTAIADTTANPLFIPTANIWYKLSLEINKSTNTYNFYINNILAASLNGVDVTPITAYYGLFIGLLNTSGTFTTPVTVAIDHYKETIIPSSPQII
jgi:hypothetical protein